MMPPSDELFEVWKSNSGEGKIDQREIVRQLEKRAKGFDRTVRLRDLRETIAGFAVTAIFLWLATLDRSLVQRAVHLWLAGCGLWIVVFLRRYSKAQAKPSPDLSLDAYREALLERYDQQIGLLKNVKLWYLLPFWLGLLAGAADRVIQGDHALSALVSASLVTAFFGLIWWLNEVVGVRSIRQKRDELLALTGTAR
jgi:hypothetical protein